MFNTILDWWKRPGSQRQPRRTKLGVEQLEDRRNPSPVFWDGGGDNIHWEDDLNWSINAQPTQFDDVEIANAALTVIHTAGLATVNSLTCAATLDFTGDLAVAADTNISGEFDLAGNLWVNGGTTTLSGGGTANATFTVAQGAQLTFLDGTFQLGGATQLLGAGQVLVGNLQQPQIGTAVWQINVPAGQVFVQAMLTLTEGGQIGDFDDPLPGGTFQITNRLIWLGGTIEKCTAEIMPGASMDVLGTGARVSIDCGLVNRGTVNYGRSHRFAGGSFNNLGTVNITASVDFFADFGPPPNFFNQGILRLDGIVTLNVRMLFSNIAGLVDVGVGTLSLNEDGMHSGTFQTAPGGTLNFQISVVNATHSFGPGSQILGGGLVHFFGDGGNRVCRIVIQPNTVLDIENLRITKDHPNNPNALVIDGQGTLMGLQIDYRSGVMTGGGWTIVKPNGTMIIGQTGLEVTLNNRTLQNHGTIDWAANAGDIKISDNVQISNDGVFGPTAFVIRNQRVVDDTRPNPPVLNSFVLTNGASLQRQGQGLARLEVTVENSNGFLTLQNNLSSLEIAGNYTVNGGTTSLFGGSLQVSGTSSHTGSFTSLQGGNFGIASNLTLSNNSYLYLDSGTLGLGFTGTLTLATNSVLSGSGFVLGHVNNLGKIEVGGVFGVGSITIQGNYTQDQSGKLSIEIAGLAPITQYDRLIVVGDATLGGELIVGLLDGFNPQGQSFDIVTIANALSGTFSEIVELPSAQDFTWSLNYTSLPTNNRVRLSAM